MAKYFDEKINRSTDWGGDESTGNLKVKGSRVQEFIKEQLDSKVGVFHLDTGTSMYVCFANEETRDKWLETKDETLVIGRFEAVSNYAVEIKNATDVTSVLASSKNNVLKFRFRVVDTRTESNTGEGVKCTYTFTNGGTVKGFSEELVQNPEADGFVTRSFVIDDYISIGTNAITIKITGKNTFASSQIGITFDVLDMVYAPIFDYTKAWEQSTIQMSYTISCAKTKYIEWWIDGAKAMDDKVILSNDGGDTLSFNGSSLEPGLHSMQTRAYVLTASGEKFYSENYFYTFAVKGGDSPLVMMHKVMEDGSFVNDMSNLVVAGQQFADISFDWAYYDPLNRRLGVTFDWNGNKISTIERSNGDGSQSFTYRPVESGTDNKLNITIYDKSGNKIFDFALGVDVDKSETSLSETTDGMILKLSAMGRNNSEGEADRASWEYLSPTDGKLYTTTFNNFSWNSLQGWNDNALVLSDGAYIDINIMPMAEDWAKNGGTVEIDIETFDVEDENAVICECSDGTDTSAFFQITATSAKIKSSGSKVLETRFKDNDRMKFAFIGNKSGNMEDSNLLYIVTNGVLDRAINYNDGDNVVSKSKLRIGNVDGKVKCRLRSIRVYNRAITVDEAWANFAIDSDNVQEVYDRNDIFDNRGEISYEKVVNKIPVLVFTGDLPEIMKLASKSITRYYDIEYTNNAEPERNFTAFHVQTKLQGTSSLGYPRKNFKIKTKNGKKTQSDFDATGMKFCNDTSNPYYRRLVDANGKLVDTTTLTTCWTFTSDGKVTKNGNLRVKSASAPKLNCWCLKADYMESSSCHNTGVAKSWNDIMKNVKLSNTNTYTSPVVEEADVISVQNDYVCRTEAQKVAEAYGTGEVRTTVDGFPIVAFYRLDYDSPLVFMGQYNFNNDKSTEELFGFEDIYNDDKTVKLFDASQVECWEGLKNTHPITLFQTADTFDEEWKDTFESRYPDQDDLDLSDPNVTKNVKQLCQWICSTRHEKDTVINESKTITIDSSFAKTQNRYQYGYGASTGDALKPFLYPESGEYPDTAENRQKKFEVEKWEHFDVWKLAGYYIYLLRYGGVDQFVKNSMLTTEGIGKYGGKYKKWYYINYDNDCVFGLRNNGELAFDYTLNRETIDPAYEGWTEEELEAADIDGRAMMGHKSTLWNNLERDNEFMRMVMALDDAMHSCGLKYEDMLKVFDEEQTDRWCERIYNANERYKYIQPFNGTSDTGIKVNNLFMLQGNRKSHRHWWLSNHMEYYDAKWISGDYKSKIMEMKADGDKGKMIHIVAGADFYYAWGNNSTLFESNVVLKPGETHSFEAPIGQVQGDPIRVYAINKIAEIDVSDYGAGIHNVNFPTISTETAHELRKVIIGQPNVVNTALQNIESISNVPNLEYLDITNCATIATLDASLLPRLNTLKANGTKLSAFNPVDGAKLTLVQLPATIQTLALNNVQFTDGNLSSLEYTPNTTLRKLTIKNSAGVGMDYYRKIVRPWIDEIAKSANSSYYYQYADMNLVNVNWSFSDINDVYVFEDFARAAAADGRFNITGVISLKSYGKLTEEDLVRLRAMFGENCFKEDNSIRIIAPISIFLRSDGSKTSTVAGQTQKFTCEIYPEKPSSFSIKYSFVKKNEDGEWVDIEDVSTIRTGISITTVEESDDEYVGLLKTPEIVTNSDTTVNVRVLMLVTGGVNRESVMSFTIKDPTYAVTKNTYISGDTSIYKDDDIREIMGDGKPDYKLIPLTDKGVEPLGTYKVEWTLEGNGTQYIDMDKSGQDPVDQNIYHIITLGTQPDISESLRLSARINSTNGSVAESSLNILMLNESVIMTNESNPVAMKLCYDAGWCQKDNAMTKEEAEAVTDIGTTFAGVSSAFSFTDEFMYFKSITSIPEGAFKDSAIEAVSIPNGVKGIGVSAFTNCTRLKSVRLPDGITNIPQYCFCGCSLLEGVVIPSSVSVINSYAFGGTNVKNILLIENKKDDVNAIYISEGLRRIENSAFETEEWTFRSESNKLERVELPASFVYYGEDVFRGKHIENFFVSEENTAFSSIDGVLYDKNIEQILRYPPLRAYVDEYGIHPGVFQIADYAFYYMRSCEKITLPDTIEANGIGKYAFYQALISHLDMSNAKNVTTISEGMCQGCEFLETVDYPMISKDLTSIETISKYAFTDCVSLPSIYVPYGVKSLELYAFKGCIGATSIDIPDSITSMGMYSIDGCKSITEVRIPYSISTAMFMCVTNCANLKKVILPPFSYTQYEALNSNGDILGTYDKESDALSVAGSDGSVNTVSTKKNSSLYRYFVYDCPNLEEYAKSDMDDGLYARFHDGCVYLNDALIKVPYGKTSCDILSDITKIDEFAVNNCNQLTSIVFNTPDLAYIMGGAFLVTRSLKNITILCDGWYDSTNNDEYHRLPILRDWLSEWPFGASTGPESSVKNFYCSYGMAEAIQNDSTWKSTLIDSAGFTVSDFLLNDDIYISKGTSGETNVYVSGSSMIPGVLVTDESNEHYGYYRFAISGIADREPLDVLVNGVTVGSIVIRYGINEYELPTMFAAMRMSNANDTTQEESTETISITKIEYDILMSKINQLSSKVQNL